MQVYLIVFLGAGLGGAMRHGVNVLTARTLGTGFPFGTLAVNIIGSLIMGLLAGYFAFRGDATQHWRLFLTTGILGGFTTFSTFSLDTAVLWERGAIAMASIYVGASVAVSIAALIAGLLVVRNWPG